MPNDKFVLALLAVERNNAAAAAFVLHIYIVYIYYIDYRERSSTI